MANTKNIMDFFGMFDEEVDDIEGIFHVLNNCPGCGSNVRFYLMKNKSNKRSSVSCGTCDCRSMLPDNVRLVPNEAGTEYWLQEY
jgi:hypothetical protein